MPARQGMEGVITMTTETACKHFWEIEAANGAESRGVCTGCGAVRYFVNYVESPNSYLNEDGTPKVNTERVNNRRKAVRK